MFLSKNVICFSIGFSYKLVSMTTRVFRVIPTIVLTFSRVDTPFPRGHFLDGIKKRKYFAIKVKKTSL